MSKEGNAIVGERFQYMSTAIDHKNHNFEDTYLVSDTFRGKTFLLGKRTRRRPIKMRRKR